MKFPGFSTALCAALEKHEGDSADKTPEDIRIDLINALKASDLVGSKTVSNRVLRLWQDGEALPSRGMTEYLAQMLEYNELIDARARDDATIERAPRGRKPGTKNKVAVAKPPAASKKSQTEAKRVLRKEKSMKERFRQERITVKLEEGPVPLSKALSIDDKSIGRGISGGIVLLTANRSGFRSLAKTGDGGLFGRDKIPASPEFTESLNHVAATLVPPLGSGRSAAELLAERMTVVCGNEWPVELVEAWLNGDESPSSDEIKLIIYAMDLAVVALLESDKDTRMISPMQAQESLDTIYSNFTAYRHLEQVEPAASAANEDLSDIVLRIGLALRFRDPKLPQFTTGRDMIPALRYLCGPSIGKSSVWLDGEGDPPEDIIEEVATKCGVEACWLRGEHRSRHSYLRYFSMNI